MPEGATLITGRTDRTPRLRVGVIGAVAGLAAIALLATSASAFVVRGPGPDASYQPRNGAAPISSALGGDLDYHGGPVMHSSTTYAIYWAPSGAFPAGYETLMNRYLTDVGTDSGQSTNVYSVGTQYTDSGGARAAYLTNFAGAFDDTNPYPASDCPTSGQFPACILDHDISNELDSFIAAHGLPRGLSTMYFVFLPQGVDSCFDPPNDGICFSNYFCAYHSFDNTGGTTIYANIPYAPTFPGGCGTGQHPNASISSVGDDTLSGVSHEHNEAITDPRLDAWFDSTGAENGDKCRNTADDYGPPLGGGPGSLFNQLIAGHGYYLQQEWSNVVGCEQRNALPNALVGAPGSGTTGQSLGFSGAASNDPDGTIIDQAWDFGDGGTATGPTAAHSYLSPGGYTAKLTVTDSNGFTSSATQPVSIATPSRTLTVSTPGAGSGHVTGPGVSCPGDCSGSYSDGTTVTLHAAPAPGSRFGGWAGACSGTGSCGLTMNANRSVSATFNRPGRPGTRLKGSRVRSNRHRASFEFKATGKAKGFQCKLNRRHRKPHRFRKCRSPKTYRHLPPARYTFKVRAVGPGGADRSPATKTFRIGGH
jgi:hypothetical protein